MPFDFTGKNIQDTYQRVLQVGDDGTVYNGTGSLVPTLLMTASHAITEVNIETSSSYAETSSFSSNFTVHGDVSASGTGSFKVVQINTTSDTRDLNVGGVIDSQGIYSSFGTFAGNINANGNIVGDNSTDISGIRNLTILGNSSMGDSDSDTHTFTGTVTTNTEINAVAGISSSAPIQTETLTGVGNTTGLVVAGFVSASEFIVKGHITASGDISASGNIMATGTGSFADIQSDGGINLVNQVSGFQFDNVPVFYHDSVHHQIGVSDNKGNIQWYSTTFSGSIFAKSHITSSGNISASGDLYGNNIYHTGKIYADGTQVLYYDDSNDFNITADRSIKLGSQATTHVTASGNISSSGTITANAYVGLPSGIVSSSDQIATPISGAFHAASSSFSTRVTTNDAKVGYTDAAVVVVLDDLGVISGSSQLPSGIFSSSLQTFTNITASGNLSVSGSIYSDQYVYNRTTSTTDGVSTGDIIYWGTATATTAGKIYYFNSSAGWTLANADALADAKGLLAVATNDNSSKGMLIRGTTTLAAVDGTNDEGLPIYLDTTDGDANVDAPTTSGHIVRIIGYLLNNSNRKVWFDPDKTWVELV